MAGDGFDDIRIIYFRHCPDRQTERQPDRHSDNATSLRCQRQRHTLSRREGTCSVSISHFLVLGTGLRTVGSVAAIGVVHLSVLFKRWYPSLIFYYRLLHFLFLFVLILSFISVALRRSGRNCSSVLILLANCQHTCMTYTIAVCTVKNYWRWTEELSETCIVLFQK